VDKGNLVSEVKIFSSRGKQFKENRGNAGYDLESTEAVTIAPFERALIKTGIYMELPEDVQVEIRPRSGLALKNGITVLNSPGTCDAEFRGEYGVILINLSNVPFNISPGDRIAQAVFMPVIHPEKIYVDSVEELSKTDRGAGGFGSTGVTA
jgi:dUTP pyrophosphatase